MASTRRLSRLQIEVSKVSTSHSVAGCVQKRNNNFTIYFSATVLGIEPSEVLAQQCKLVSFIQVSKFDEALKFLNKCPELKGLDFEKAYCQYRLNLPEEALKTIDTNCAQPLAENVKELRAQVLYRLERFEECLNSYRDLIKNTQDEYDDERLTNMSAVAANLADAGHAKALPDLREDTYELAYNKACALAGEKKFLDAEKRLRASEKMCREFLEEDGATEEDIQAELAIIKVQLAYCLQMQGRSKEAAVIYADALKNKPNDVALVAVASNNCVVVNRDQNMFDSKKKIKAALADACEHKLTSRQKKTIALNNCLLTYYINQHGDQLHKLCAALQKAHPDLEFKTLLISVSQLARDRKFKEAVEKLQKVPRTQAVDELAIQLAICQLQLLSGNRKAAIEVLQGLGDAKYKPGVVSALVSLMSDNRQGASEVLKQSVEWYKANKDKAGDLSEMWRQAADFHMRGGQPEVAASSLVELLAKNPADVKIIAQLVIAYAQFDQSKAQKASKDLPALDASASAQEVDSLEAANWMMATKAVKKTVTKGEMSPGPGSDKGKARQTRKRKGKLPKHHNPNVQPDPERWLPKYERTGYRKKRDRRVKEVMKGSQGMATGAADQ